MTFGHHRVMLLYFQGIPPFPLVAELVQSPLLTTLTPHCPTCTRTRNVSSADVVAVASKEKKISQSDCVHLYSSAGVSTPLHGAIICCVTDEGSRVQLMNICLVFMAFKYHQALQVVPYRYLCRR